MLQSLLERDANDPKVLAKDRSAIVRAWVDVQYLIQELRGIPKPGQLRPDLDPKQMLRMMKRANGRASKMIDLTPNAKGKFAELNEEQTPTPTKSATKTKTKTDPEPEPEEKKESLLPGQTVTTPPTGAGA